MTGRVCEVHGEWGATGACRWCEPTMYGESPGTSALRDVKAIAEMLGDPHPRWDADPPALLPPTCICKTCLRSFEAPIPLTSLECSECRSKARIYIPTAADLPIQPPVVLEWQHAALRWERVARRWNYKHGRSSGLDEEGRAYVWRSWLSQVDRIYRAALREEPP